MWIEIGNSLLPFEPKTRQEFVSLVRVEELYRAGCGFENFEQSCNLHTRRKGYQYDRHTLYQWWYPKLGFHAVGLSGLTIEEAYEHINEILWKVVEPRKQKPH